MNLILPLVNLKEEDLNKVGGKANSLAYLLQNDFQIPFGYVMTTDFFEEFLNYNKLRPKINLEISRKSFENMRWEEIWDTSLRIKNMIIKAKIPSKLKNELKEKITNNKKIKSWVVRSSSIAEDSNSSSFAGLHDSYINVIGLDDLLEKIKLVWASLYSDGALMYRKELSLNLNSMSMAVVIQQFRPGESSGICFSVNPINPSQSIVESVIGLNQALVDGDIDPDRWIINRDTNKIIEHIKNFQSQKMVATKKGVRFIKIDKKKAYILPLNDSEIIEIYKICRKSEDIFHNPQDMEWTKADGKIYVLQSRPITRKKEDKNDQRPWYLSLKRTLSNLEELKEKIEIKLIPELIKTTKELEKNNLDSKTKIELSNEIKKRKKIFDSWTDIYWKYFIPFAHGMRLFGSIYNERIKPKDPYEFMIILEGGTNLEVIKRNNRFRKISVLVQEYDSSKNMTKLIQEVDFFINEFPEISLGVFSKEEIRKNIIKLAREFKGKSNDSKRNKKEKLKTAFLMSFPKNEKKYAEKLLEIGKASYYLRDNDNIYIGRLERCLEKAMEVAIKRLEKKSKKIIFTDIKPLELAKMLINPSYTPKKLLNKDCKKTDSRLKVSQIVGQPASKGVASGYAKVVKNKKDLFEIKKGDIIVVDSIDPNMTFVIPLCSGIIERRGGMLIHGAIIAREYNIPCITGITDATNIIKTGDYIYLDGENGIVAIRPGKK